MSDLAAILRGFVFGLTAMGAAILLLHALGELP